MVSNGFSFDSFDEINVASLATIRILSCLALFIWFRRRTRLMYFRRDWSCWYDGTSTINSFSSSMLRLGKRLGVLVWLILLDLDCLSKSILPSLFRQSFLRFKDSIITDLPHKGSPMTKTTVLSLI